MIHATVYLNRIAKRRIGSAIQHAAMAEGIKLTKGFRVKEWLSQFQSDRRIITWGLKVPGSLYEQRKDVLFVEHGFLCQSKRMWIDEDGWFNYSSLSKHKQYLDDYTAQEANKIHDICENDLKWKLFSHSNTNGPLLYAIQRGSDSSARFYFPARDPDLGSVEAGLTLLAKYGPKYPTLIRPHPKASDRPGFSSRRFSSCWQDHWTVDESSNVYETLRNCCGVICINSTLATECQMFGMKVATLGESMFSGSGVTFECAYDPSRLRNFLDWDPPSQEIIMKYLCAILRHQLDYDSSSEQIRENKSFQNWIRRLHDGAGEEA